MLEETAKQAVAVARWQRAHHWIGLRDDSRLGEQVRLLHEHATLSQLVALVNSSLLVYVLWGLVDRFRLLVWLGGVFGVSLLRLQQSRAYTRLAPPPQRIRESRNRFLIGVTASGLLWGGAGLLLWPESSLPHQLFVTFVVAGMVAGAVGTLSVLMAAFLLFTIPATLPIVVQFLLHGGELHFQMSFLTVLYGLAMTAVARYMHGTIKDGIELNRRNAELVEVLTAANAHAELLNRELQDEIGERERRERQLDGERDVLQAIAAGAPLARGLEQLCRLVEAQLPSTMCSVFLLDEDGERLRHGAAPSLPEAYTRTVEGIAIGPQAGACWSAAHLNRPVIVADIASDEAGRAYRAVALEHGLRACWSVPIPGSERTVLGAFAVYHCMPRAPAPAEMALIARAGDIARIAIERSYAELRIERLAHYDELTGLPNRLLFGRALDDALAQSERTGQAVALLFVDVDRFKDVNETLGHAIGDRLLKEVATRLRRCLRGSDLLARFGGDQFAAMLPAPPYEGYALGVAAKLLAALTEPLRVEEREFHVTASVGVATCPQDGRDAESLQKHADTALREAKEQGRNSVRRYSPHGEAPARERLTLEASLRQAVAGRQLELHYQPKQDIVGGRITGAEALLRWRHPELGLIPPERFIPLAEETGLITSVGEWVLRTACAQAAGLQRLNGPGLPRIAINLSARQFSDQSLVPLITEVLAETGLEPSRLELEITESVIMRNAEQAARLLAQLKEMGIALAMDDFGTGYSSLSYLKRFPVDAIKIDRSFVLGLPSDEENASITQAVIAMAHSLRLRTIAEGVETAEQLAFLRRHGCDEIQGYWFSRPLPIEELEQLLRTYAARTPTPRPSPEIPVWP